MPSTTITKTPNQAKAVSNETTEMLQAAEASHTKPLWLQMSKFNPALPNPRCTPHVWKYSDIKPTLLQAGRLVSEQQAERRVLMFVNPSREAPFTTDTLYAGLQLVMPNETAKAHRHTAFAMRFIIEGNGGFTAVHGKRIQMNRGDVILTPTWNWHDHGKDGSGPMIWLDGLDLPNFTHFPVHFVEHYSSPRYPAENVDTSQSSIVFPWTRMKSALDSEEGHYATKRYLRADGLEVSKVLGGCAVRLNPGTQSPRVQETASSVYHVIEGSGRTQIGEEIFTWKKGDTFCIPSWYPFQHTADEGLEAAVYLFRFDDIPMLKNLGFYRSADMDVERLVSA